MKKKNNVATISKLIIIMLVLGVIFASITYKVGESNGHRRGLADGARVSKQYLSSDNEKLDKCLADAQIKFDNIANLNTVESVVNGETARRWNSSEVKDETTQQFNIDRDFCLKLYK